MPSADELEARARQLTDELKKTLRELDNLKAQQAAEAQTPEQRRRQYRVLKGGAAAAALTLLWQRKSEVVVVASMGALVAGMLIGLPGSGNGDGGSKEFFAEEGLPAEPAPTRAPKAEAVVEIEELEPEPIDDEPVAPPPQELLLEPAPLAESSAPNVQALGESAPAPAPEPEPEPGPGPGEGPSPPETVPPEPGPKPDPEPEPGPELHEDDDSCLDLDLRPVTDLGVCIRELLGLLE